MASAQIICINFQVGEWSLNDDLYILKIRIRIIRLIRIAPEPCSNPHVSRMSPFSRLDDPQMTPWFSGSVHESDPIWLCVFYIGCEDHIGISSLYPQFMMIKPYQTILNYDFGICLMIHRVNIGIWGWFLLPIPYTISTRKLRLPETKVEVAHGMA